MSHNSKTIKNGDDEKKKNGDDEKKKNCASAILEC